MPYVEPSHLEEAIAFKCRLWLNDFLGLAERASADPAVKLGGTSRPVEYVRAAEILEVQVVGTPAVAVGIRSFEKPRNQGTESWSRVNVDIAARFGCGAGVPTFDVGVGPRLYLSALWNLFHQPVCRDLGDGVRVGQVVETAIGDPQQTRNGDQFAIAVVTVEVDAPFADHSVAFDLPPDGLPGPNDPPREPDSPLTILNLITSVEQMP